MKNRVRELRLARGWTQAQLAENADVSRQTINAIEKGRFDPSLPVALRLARLFACATEEIFFDDVPPSRRKNTQKTNDMNTLAVPLICAP